MTNNSSVSTIFNHFNPSKNALWDWLKPYIDDSILREIARADLGDDEEEANFHSLKLIYELQQVPFYLRWIPRQALEVKRWIEPDDPNFHTSPANSKGIRGHLIRAFCCTILLIAADNPEQYGTPADENETLVQLIDSVIHLGHEAAECALRFLSWRVLRLHEQEDEESFFEFGVLLLRTFLFEPHQDGADLSLLVDWLLTDAQKYKEGMLSRTMYHRRHYVWRRLAQTILLDPSKGFPMQTAVAMQSIVTQLISERE